MSEIEPMGPAHSQLEALIAEVESKFIDAEDALSELRHAVRRLKAYRPPARGTSEPMATEPMATSAQPAPDAGSGWTASPGDPTRDEVSRIVAETRSEMQGESKPKLGEETVGVPFWPTTKQTEPPAERFHALESYGMDSTSEASWPVARTPDVPPMSASREHARPGSPGEAAAPDTQAAESGVGHSSDDDEARRQEVARLVAQMRNGAAVEEEMPAAPAAEVWGDSDEAPSATAEVTAEGMPATPAEGAELEPWPEAMPEEAPAPDDHEARRQDVARMVAELRDGLGMETEPAVEEDDTTAADDEEARRQEVARMVAEMRQGGIDAEVTGEEAAASPNGTADKEDVVDMVAQIRAELDGAASEQEPPAGSAEDDAEVRDEVRRAVEEARAELSPGEGESDGGASRFAFTDWQNVHPEPSGPPVIVIKDAEGRVELARVYETLSMLQCDENAALLNYTPHSVTIGLNIKSAVPDADALSEAVRSVFGRACRVDSDGVRVNVQIGNNMKKDSAA